ncbi:MAG: glycoside hydrolase family 127 protein, partial [Tannerella sp.]|nr:glycoside hydrolase family 127 protein [Tannerella sp.]
RKSGGTTAAGLDYSLPAEAYKPRMRASDPAGWHHVTFGAVAPSGGVVLSGEGLFGQAMERNILYLLNSFSVNHILHPFRIRAGKPFEPDSVPQVGFWDTELRGSSAGRFLMGAGNTLRWIDHAELRACLDEIIDGIEDCRTPDGYILPYEPYPDSLRSEEPNYARAWLTHGLIDAAIAGNPKADGLLRGHADWFNSWELMLPKLLYWVHNSHQGHIASTRTYLSPVGKPEDLQTAEKYYVCDWWIDELTAGREEAIWQYPLQNPHSYLIASFEAYLDHYIATGDKAFLNAMLGAWELMRDNWVHTGGSIAICENQWDIENGKRVLKHYDKTHECSHPPRSYYLTGYGHTGETCGSAFWIKFNQRLHQLYPGEEKYMAEIEKSIYNVLLANQQSDGMIRYHALMQGRKEFFRKASNSCCEGQGTRLLGSLPEYIYSIAPDGLYINLYEPSSIRWEVNRNPVELSLESRFPFNPEVALKISAPVPVTMNLRIRIPAWATQRVAISVNGKPSATGKPGSYVELSRKWQDGDRIDFTLPAGVRLSPYQGLDTVPGYRRYAVEYGPLLLAATGEGDIPHILGSHPAENKLIPDPSRPLHFVIPGDESHSFMPYCLISDEAFTVFPLVKSDGDK